ncbi:hypothetical protein [Aestuariivirga litoralis]|uniref:hypothetical protein n=1 Tax=Aestuariivirga litoralis TaxID=2650924 RepID=UPI0018C841D1|nr:hypothetical protein [Aestuariivirga litoralis]MBG1231237.1 hypothetical protein [Aestuariivirga litoralis]
MILASSAHWSLPPSLPALIAAAERLAADFFVVGIDRHTDGKETRIGEITHCSNSAATPVTPSEAEILASQLMFTGITQEQWEAFFDV